MSKLLAVAHYATSPDVAAAMELVSKHVVGNPNIPLWAGVIAESPHARWGSASHILLLGLRGTHGQIRPGRGWNGARAEQPYVYLSAAAGGERSTPIPVADDEALRMARALNDAAIEGCSAPDLLALTGWKPLQDNECDVRAAVLARRPSTDRMWAVRRHFLSAAVAA
ncbi:hypothetical protein [Mycolicibacterium fallax]|uniref:hypothetical protein n=1 Tax=Mycolicibacterium fallax TaxID=1793 RepID=UPI00138D3529|nr:hypothetical protein [Mycolicibacterium fallax]BBZ00541.1 hypothetical protein MFAL_40070 [Mycolicibacterium fallax]